MNAELQNAIRLGMCCGWIKTITKPVQMPELARRKIPNRGGITIDRCSIVNCGTAIHVENSHLEITESRIEKCVTAISASGNTYIDASYMLVDECETVFKEINQ